MPNRHAKALWRFPEGLFVPRTWLTGTKKNKRSMKWALHFDTEPNSKLKNNKRKTMTIAHRHRAKAYLWRKKNKTHDSQGVQNPCVILTAYSGCIMYNELKQTLLKCNTFQLYVRLCSHLKETKRKFGIGKQLKMILRRSLGQSIDHLCAHWAVPNYPIQWLYIRFSVIAFTIWIYHINLNWSSLKLIGLHSFALHTATDFKID